MVHQTTIRLQSGMSVKNLETVLNYNLILNLEMENSFLGRITGLTVGPLLCRINKERRKS